MSLAERITADLKTAMLTGDRTATSTLRLLKSELKNAEIANNAPLEEAAILQIIRREAKKRHEAAQLLTQAGAGERSSQEESEALFLEQYLPAQADPVSIEEWLCSYFTTHPEAQKGELIREALAHFAGTADGRTVSELVSRLRP